MSHPIDHLSPPRLAAFVSVEIPMAAFLMPLVIYVPPFYAGEMGLGLSTVGLIFGLAKLWDVVTDPIAGLLTDRYGPTNGRRRFWLLLSLPLMLISIYQVFLPASGVGWEHVALWMVILYVGWTLLTISHISWGVELSGDYHERARIAAYRQAAALIGGAIVVLIPVFSDQLGAGTEASRIANIGIFVMVALPAFMAATTICTPPTPVKETSHRHGLRDFFVILRRNRSLRALLVGNMAILLGMAATGSTLIFYVEKVLLLGEWASFSVIPGLFSGLLYLPLLKWFTRRYGKHTTFRWVLMFQLAVQPVLLVIPPENLGITVLAFILSGAVYGAATFLPLAMIADLRDVDTGSDADQTGIYVALLQSTSKVSGGLAIALMFLALPLTGFNPDPDVVNDDSSLYGLRYMMVLVPMACYGIGVFGMRKYDLDENAYRALRCRDESPSSRGSESWK